MARHFAFIGQVKPTKGLREILDAASRPDLRVDVYGPLQDAMSERDFEGSNVHYRGSLAPEEVMPTPCRYDAVLLPTYHDGEGYPGIVLEAYAAGVPVIATRWRALPEIVEDGVSGLLVEPRDAAELARAMQRLADSAELTARLSAGARAEAARFDSRVWLDRFVSICRTAASGDWSREAE